MKRREKGGERGEVKKREVKRREKGGERREGGGKEEGGEEEGHRGGIGKKEREEVGKLRKKEASEGWREDK